MSLIQGFTRIETIELAGTTSNRLQSLERAELIIPTRIGNSPRPAVFYTWEQILEIRAIKSSKEKASAQAVKNVIEFLDKNGLDDSFSDKQIIVMDEHVFWVRIDWIDFFEQMPERLKTDIQAADHIRQYLLIVIPHLSTIVSEVWQAAENSKAVDFETFKQRAKASQLKTGD